MEQFHEGTHSGQTTQHFYIPKLSIISKTVCERCSLCAENKGQERHPKCKVLEELLLKDLIVDFTEMPRATGYKYLLVFVWTSSG
jgi:hypothetical protein